MARAPRAPGREARGGGQDLGPLIATDSDALHPLHALRALHAGDRRLDGLGQAFRGEHAEIMPFIEKTVDSELSGNVIDLCPVALTSKPLPLRRPYLGAVAPQVGQPARRPASAPT
ncbi:MAG: hypothetical protein R3E40_09320 [Rhodocyclaceae bacterium]